MLCAAGHNALVDVDEDSVGGRIKAAYVEAGMNRSQFARQLEVAYTTVYNWELGKKSPRSKSLQAIEALTGVSVSALLGKPDMPVGPDAWPAFATSPQGTSLTPEERGILLSIDWHTVIPTPVMFSSILSLIRMRKAEG